jgi:serine phosphatase RsbU (regulator of sigma subunit)/CheY-like chemotaxis protein
MSKARIMVVEDEGVTALQIRESLEGMGYDVPLVALTGEEAVDKVLETEPDLVLMDIKLTGRLSGIDAAHKIRGRLNVPVVYLTAFSDEETLALAQVTDPDGYVLKPFDDKSLHAIIEMSLSRYQHAREERESGMWMSALAESMTEAVLICDAKGYVKFINPAAEALIGKRLREVQEMRMRDVVSLLDTETRAPLPFPVTEPLLEGRSTMRGNCSLRAGEDREYAVEFTASPLRSPEGTLFGILYVLRRTGDRELIHGRVLRELDALSRLQKRSLPSGDAVIPGVTLQWILLPAQFGGGDALGCMPLDEGHVGFYSLTVPGGGLLSAMFSLLLGMFLTPSFDKGGILVENLCQEPGRRVLTPAQVVQVLGNRFFLKDEATPYFTLVYGVLENATGTVSLVRAGHPSPVYQSADGMVRLLKPEGQGIGIAPGAEVKMETLQLGRNDRLFLSSEGLAACENRAGERFSSDRLVQSISVSRRKSLRDAVADIREEISQWRGNEPFAADASILALEKE